MFAVKPIPSKELQEEICNKLNAVYMENSLAYFAAELADDLSSVAGLIGICQFTPGETAVMNTLVPAHGYENDEAMIIMCRTAMNFMWRHGAKAMLLPCDAGPQKLLASCGLSVCDGGYFVDLDKFYASPCHYEPSKDTELNK